MELAEVPAFIRENLLEDLSIDFLSKACYCSTSAFKNRFKAEFGETIGSYITKTRMHVAADLLTSGKRCSIRNIVQEVGYINGGNFSKKFKALYGCLPEDVFIQAGKYNPVNEADKHASLIVLANKIYNCPEKLKKDFEKHFGKPLAAFLLSAEKVAAVE